MSDKSIDDTEDDSISWHRKKKRKETKTTKKSRTNNDDFVTTAAADKDKRNHHKQKPISDSNRDEDYHNNNDRENIKRSVQKKSKKRKRSYNNDDDDDDDELNDDTSPIISTERYDDKKKKSKSRYKPSHYDSDNDSYDKTKKRGSHNNPKSSRKLKKEEKKKKKSKQKKVKKSKSNKRSNKDDEDDESSNSTTSNDNELSCKHNGNKYKRNYELADALLDLFENHPVFAEDLPIMLIRLAGGTVFNLESMPASVSEKLVKVFQCLQPFGITQQEEKSYDDVSNSHNRTITNTSSWFWKNANTFHQHRPKPNTKNEELILVKVVRTLLNEIGVTIDSINEYENPRLQVPTNQQSQSEHERLEPSASNQTEVSENELSTQEKIVLEFTNSLLMHQILQLGKTPDGNENEARHALANEIVELIRMIMEGECVSMNGLPNETMRQSLESLFKACGLDLLEMQDDEYEDETIQRSSSDENATDPVESKNAQEATFGYGLPEEEGLARNQSISLLSSVLSVCQHVTASVESMNTKKQEYRRILGPTLPPNDDFGSSDEEGPKRIGSSAHRVKSTSHFPSNTHSTTAAPNESGREEWMLVPGKYDFLGAIKAGHTIRSRTFEGKSKANKDDVNDRKPIDPVIQSELNAIRQAHEKARGPSLMEIHRKQKAEERINTTSNKQNGWKWNRDSDLDAGRRVDNDALKMILGGAGKDLKTKFQEGG